MGEGAVNRRWFLRGVFVTAAVPLVPLLSAIPNHPGVIVFLEEQVVYNPNDFGFLWRCIATCDGQYAAVSVQTYDDPRSSIDLERLIRREAQEKVRQYWREKRVGVRRYLP